MIRLIARGSRLIENQGVWKGAGWGVATMAAIDGISYIIFGNKIAGGPSFTLLREAPWGMRSIGVVMCVVGALLFGTVHRRDKWSQIALFLAFFLGITLVCYTVGGWLATKPHPQASVSTITKWFLLTWLALWLSATTYHPRGPRHARS